MFTGPFEVQPSSGTVLRSGGLTGTCIFWLNSSRQIYDRDDFAPMNSICSLKVDFKSTHRSVFL